MKMKQHIVLRRLKGLKTLYQCRYLSSDKINSSPLKSSYDAIVVGSGHNGLVSAAYLQKNGFDVCVLERRHVIGGAAVTEEIVPGYKFSRASYVLSLLRPQVYEDLELRKYGLNVYLRDPNAYTPLIEPQTIKGQKVTSLILGRDASKTQEQIAQFSKKDAQLETFMFMPKRSSIMASSYFMKHFSWDPQKQSMSAKQPCYIQTKRYGEFEEFLERIASSIDPLLDNQPLHLPTAIHGTFREKLATLSGYTSLAKAFKKMGKEIPEFYELMTAPTTKILDKWFESEPLKATLATDSVIGAMISPETPGSGYVLLHHVMGEIEGVKGAWGYVEGGMGSVSAAIANCAIDHGASVYTNKPVSSIITKDGVAEGVTLEDGTEIRAKAVLSNATPKITFLDLLPQGTMDEDVISTVRQFNYDSPVTKINVAVNKIPNFLANPNTSANAVMPHHRCTIHLNCEHSSLIHEAYLAAQAGSYSKRPMIEMTIPSSLDPTLAPEGHHVVLLFTQYTPYNLANGKTWNEEERNKYADTIFDCIEDYAPGFKESVVGRDILTPPDLERVFGLTGGNIFHGAMSLDQLYMMRPTAGLSGYRTPVRGLYLCGSGAHPGGGVMGSAGRLAALTVLDDKKMLWN